MTCKDCIHYSDCNDIAFHNFDHYHRMWMYEFWDNAHERCESFEKFKEEDTYDLDR